MTDRKQTNKYYPPDYDPSKGSLNTQLGQHALRKRAAKLDQGILVVRFEMPVNVWCQGCGAHIGKGVRYNAEKQQVDAAELDAPGGKYHSRDGYRASAGGLSYFSTKLWQFSMKCHLCNHRLVVRTDPQHAAYEMFSGLRAKDESFCAEDNQTIEVLSSEERVRVRSDALFATEHEQRDRRIAEQEHERTAALVARNEQFASGGDFDANSRLRASLRASKKSDAAAMAAGRARGINMQLLPQSEEDALISHSVLFKQPREAVQQRHELKRMRIRESVFDGAHTQGAAAASSAAAAASSAAAADLPDSSRARAIQRAIDTGIDLRALAPIAGATPSHYSSSSLLNSTQRLPPAKLPLARLPAPVPAAAVADSTISSDAAAAANGDKVKKQKKRKRDPEESKHSSFTAASAAGTVDAAVASGGILGLGAYDSDAE
jgi:coiled-coil domain-containing protein 130